MKRLRISLYLIGAVCIALGVPLALFMPKTVMTFNPEPVRLVVTVGENAAAQQSFNVERSGAYDVIAEGNITWEVTSRRAVVAMGDSKRQGSFNAEVSKPYLLTVRAIRRGPADITVRLNAKELKELRVAEETRREFRQMGRWGAILGAGALVIALLLHLERRPQAA
jgi:hypothetical protein